jgi:ATP-dependent RNA helicase DDX46/PRP5
MVTVWSITDDIYLFIFTVGFLEKLKTGKAHAAGSGFGGKGLDRLDKERDDRAKAERKAYGEPDDEKAAEKVPDAAAATTTTTESAPQDDMDFGKFKVEVKRGPAPDSSKGLGVPGAAAAARRLVQQKEEERIQASLKQAEEAATRAGKDTPAGKQALSVVAKLNAQLRAHKLVAQSQLQHEEAGGSMPAKKPNPDATEFHAIIPINDYPQKARWKVTNKETMVQLVDMTGASVTNKGAWYLTQYFIRLLIHLYRYLL